MTTPDQQLALTVATWPSDLASDLVAGDNNSQADIFVRDRTNRIIERVSISSDADEGNGPSYSPSISADGRYVAFTSWSSNLVEGDTNGTLDVFIRDRLTETTRRVSVSSAGAEGNQSSSDSAISADGRTVVFNSSASNLVSGDTNRWVDTFVHDLVTGATERVNLASTGSQDPTTVQVSSRASISADGTQVAFDSMACLAGTNCNSLRNVFVRDRGPSTSPAPPTPTPAVPPRPRRPGRRRPLYSRRASDPGSPREPISTVMTRWTSSRENPWSFASFQALIQPVQSEAWKTLMSQSASRAPRLLRVANSLFSAWTPPRRSISFSSRTSPAIRRSLFG